MFRRPSPNMASSNGCGLWKRRPSKWSDVGPRQPVLVGGPQAPRRARHPLRGPADDRRRADQPQSLRSHGPGDAPTPGRGVPSAHRHGARQLRVPPSPRSPGRAGHRLVAVGRPRARRAAHGSTGAALVGAVDQRQVAHALARIRDRERVGARLLRRRHGIRRVSRADPRSLRSPASRHAADQPVAATSRDGAAAHVGGRCGARVRAAERLYGDRHALRHLPPGRGRRGGPGGLARARGEAGVAVHAALLGALQWRGAGRAATVDAGGRSVPRARADDDASSVGDAAG